MRGLVLRIGVLAAGTVGLLSAVGTSNGPPPYEVRAIFDSAPVNAGADVLVAGVRIGTVDRLDVTPDHKAALTLRIDDRRFTPFRTDARCGTRQQSLIGERAVTCETGSVRAALLAPISNGAGQGAHLLPARRTYSAIDLDLVNAIYRRPAPQQLSILLSELGAGVATRGPRLVSIIRRANPALDEADRLIRQLATQRRELQRLAVDGERATRPLARRRRELAGFLRSSERTAAIALENRAAYAAGFDRLPASLRNLTPLMRELDRFARGTAPVLRSIAAGAPDLGRATRAIAPFARQSDPTLRRLATTAHVQARELARAVPLARRLDVLGRRLRRPATDASRLFESFHAGNGIPNLLASIYGSANAANGFDRFGHYARTEVLSGVCGQYTTTQFFGCDSQFGAAAEGARVRPASLASVPMLDYLLGSGRR